MKKKWLFLITTVLLVTFLAGCTEIDKEITADSQGFWNEYFVYPLSWLITTISEFFNGNYGLGIVVVTIMIRLVLLPLMIKQMKSSKAMQALQPEMQALREKYSSKDATSQQKLQQETMALFQQHGVNPIAGCLPLIVQMPILFAFYQAIMRTFEIREHNFLWFDLGEADIALALIAGVTTFIQQKIMMAGTETVNPQMQMMLYIMPVMIVVFAITFPAALSLYWVVGNIFMIVQTFFIKGPDMRKIQQTVATDGGKKK
ncbi:YidC family membrane integrase SpoIIIJ [Mangrovibacillus cuniculi]|uniref:Membrane protein insertase YidC n=1 Tax=Mangrovibacillus cuniculi TaxID=2593652 RepID=A0A7S8HGZ1_9BACI|nr:YidC family membrane integrase SpoIIIJ [Mangrovibacillus cuniculi]QPC47930.1 YidC family membrane integrase SpoIIIJ [Mangrovibacillus cuniculi]